MTNHKKHMTIGLGACAAAATAIAGLTLTGADPAEGDQRSFACAVEDEVLVSVEEDAFDMLEGSLRCVHIDALVLPVQG